MIESFESVEKVLRLSVMPRSNVSDSSQLALSLDYESLILSEDNIAQGSMTSEGNNRCRILTLKASPTVTAGIYEYAVEASREGEDGSSGMGSGQLFRVTCRITNVKGSKEVFN